MIEYIIYNDRMIMNLEIRKYIVSTIVPVQYIPVPYEWKFVARLKV